MKRTNLHVAVLASLALPSAANGGPAAVNRPVGSLTPRFEPWLPVRDQRRPHIKGNRAQRRRIFDGFQAMMR